MRKYSWRQGARAPKGLKAESAAAELRRIEEEAGTLTPDHVVEAARSKKNPLHKAFEWDNNKAAQEYRLTQARSLIASIEVVYEEAQAVGKVRAYVNVDAEDGGRKYSQTENALSFSDIRQRILKRALSEASEWQRRYKQITELSEVFVALDTIKEKVA